MTNDNYNDTRVYLKKRGKMCSDIEACTKCPLSADRNKRGLLCYKFEENYPEEAIATVKEWYEQNANVTYKDDFLSKFPSAKIFDGYPLATACFIYPKIRCKDCPSSPRNCKKCWDIEMED